MKLGRSDITVSPLGVGAWAWGDRLYWGYGRGYQEKDILGAFTASLEAGVDFIDTAEIYGMGRSETFIGKFLAGESFSGGQPPCIATKFFPFPWRVTRGSLVRALRGSLRRLGLSQVDLYQVHWPPLTFPTESLADALAEIVQAGLARAVGVSNYNAAQTRRIQAALELRQVYLASNQLPYSLLDRRYEFNGTLQTCRELDVTVLSYSPLAQGSLSGKYNSQSVPKGLRSRVYTPQLLNRIQPLLTALAEIGLAHQRKTLAQVALNWALCKDTLPIPGAKNSRQALENAGAMGWRLSPEEIQRLDEISARVQK